METDHQPRPHCGQGGGLCLSPLRRHGPQDPASRNQPRHQAQEERNPPPMPPSKQLTFITRCDWALIVFSTKLNTKWKEKKQEYEYVRIWALK